MHDKLCNLLEACEAPEAPLCPLQEVTLKNGIWYGDEPICRSELFKNLPWIKKQKMIAGLRLKADDGFFTVKMLNSLRIINKGLKGADPADDKAERKWLEGRKRIKSSNRRKIKTAHKQASHNLMLF